jgi:hypothetical protein
MSQGQIENFVITNLQTALQERLFPAVTVWNRLEGRPRTQNFDRALKAEIRDALWMITRQWQMGEYLGDDAGSPIFAKLHLATTELTQYRPDSHPAESFPQNIPLEAMVERRPLPFVQNGQPMALDLRLLMGRQWLKLLRTVTVSNADRDAYLTAYPIEEPDPNDPNDAAICAHPEAWAMVSAVAGKHLDGGKLYLYLKSAAGRLATDGITLSNPDPNFKQSIDDLGTRFVEWFEKLIFQPVELAGAPLEDATEPVGRDAWLPDRLEYQFTVAAPVGEPDAEGQQTQKVLSAQEYYHGRLDWYNFEVDPTPEASEAMDADPLDTDPRGTDTQTFIPTPLTFDGMPNTRWWTFEDRRTNFGDIKPDTSELAKLMLIEFGLIYANDWYLLPYPLKVGSIALIRGLAVTNVFGERLWIEAAGRGQDDAWQRWSMFTLNTKGFNDEPADTSLVILPTVPKIQEGKPLEQVTLIRDEVANMVWGIEKLVPLPTGQSKPGGEAAREFHKFLQLPFDAQIALLQARLAVLEAITPEDLTPAEAAELADIQDTLRDILPPDPQAPIRYQVMSSVPENWIPFIPVHQENDNRQIQLQRAAMPRILRGDPNPPLRVRPRTSLLRVGLETQPRTPYLLHEEEVPRAGVVVKQSMQRTRWNDGRVWTWLGTQKQTGRGEGSSGLAFDQIIDVPTKSTNA